MFQMSLEGISFERRALIGDGRATGGRWAGDGRPDVTLVTSLDQLLYLLPAVLCNE